MVNKLTIQHKRSSVAGNAPTAATLAIGELAINFPDKTLYTKDASGVVTIIARDVAKSAIAPTSPIEGDLWYDTANDKLKAYNGTSWDDVGSVAGGSGEVQFNDGGVAGSDPLFTYDKTTDTLSTANLSSTGTFTASALSANGSIGTAGQILKSDGTKVYWDIETPFNANAQLTFANTITFSNTVSIDALSANGTVGTAGQVLRTNGTDTYWSTISEFNANGQITFANTITFSNTVDFDNTITVSGISANGSTGTAGQVLASDGTNTYWVTPTNGTVTSIATGTGLSGGPITSNGTISLADTAVTPASYGSANTATVFTVDQQGRLTNASGVSIAIDWTQIISGKPTTLSGYGITDGLTANSQIAFGNTITFSNTVTLGALSANGSVGTAGQVLTTSGSDTYWSTINGFDANAQITFANTITFSNTATVGALSANGSIGSAGQVLFSDGTKTYWGAAGGTGTVTSITAGSGLTGGTITTSNTIAVDVAAQFAWTNTHSFSNTVSLNAISANGALGTAGQVLTSTGTDTYWSTINGVDANAQYTWANTQTFSNTITIGAVSANGTSGSAGQVLKSDGTKTYWDTDNSFDANSQITFANTITFSNTVTIGKVSANGATGTTGQILTANSTGGTYWQTPTYLSANDQITFANTITFSNTVTIGALSANGSVGTAGQVLLSNGTDTYWGTDNVGVYSITAGAGLTGGTITTTNTVAVDTDYAFTFANNITFSKNVVIGALSANGSIGTAGQVLKSDGSIVYWDTAGGTGTVTSVTAGAGLTGGTITTSNTIAVDTDYSFTWANTQTFSNTITIGAVSANGSLGATGQVLTSNGTATYWSTAGGSSTIIKDEFVGNGATAAYTLSAAPASDVYVFPYINGLLQHDSTYSVSGTTITFNSNIPNGANLEIRTISSITLANAVPLTGGTVSGNLTISGNTTINGLSANGSVGTAGQVLTSNGTATYWATSTSSTNVNATYAWTNTHSFSNTVTFGAISANGSIGTAGQVLYSDGAKTYWANTSGSKWTDTGSNIYRNSNVAIGSTTAPTTALYVTGDTTVTANLTVDTSTLVVDATNNRVGIGNTAPTVELEVTGQAKISANVAIDTSTLFVDAVNNRVGFGNTTPVSQVDVNGTAAHNVVAVAASAMDLSAGQVFTKTAAGNLTWTFTNVPAGRAMTVVLHLTNGATGTQTWPASVKWPGGTAPTLTAAGVDVLVFNTHDGGTTWRGNIFGKDIK